MSPKSLVEPVEPSVGLHGKSPSSNHIQRDRYSQALLPLNGGNAELPPLKGQLLKWIGNKQKFATEIASYFPKDYGRYFEPFLGSGAILAHLAPSRGVASDCFMPLMEIWRQLQDDAEKVVLWYSDRHELIEKLGKVEAYEKVKEAYNASPNGADLLFLSRVCYGGVVRFRMRDGYMSTPCGPHRPMSPDSFAERARVWAKRTKSVDFQCAGYEKVMAEANDGDICYLDPPYSDSQSILYGAQRFSLLQLFQSIDECKKRGVRVALSIDGTKKSGDKKVMLPIPDGLFKREVSIHLGRSMLRRFQMDGKTLEAENVSDRLLLSY